jgi:Na+/glutamate symporter
MVDHDHSQNQPSLYGEKFWRSRAGIALVVFLAVAGFLLIYEHRVHVFTGTGLLIGLLGLCIGMHLFMHGGHGGHGNDNTNANRGDRP